MLPLVTRREARLSATALRTASVRLTIFMLVLLAPMLGATAAEDEEIDEQVLKNRLNNLESQAVQRDGREPTTLDLLNRQDDKIAGQKLNTLKTKKPGSDIIRRLERKLDRSRRLQDRVGRP